MLALSTESYNVGKRLTSLVRLSWQAIRIRAAVAGDSNLKSRLQPLASRAAAMASLMAKNAELPINRGGSPTA